MTNLATVEARSDASRRLPDGRYGLKHVVAAEVTKFLSVRSTLWTILVTVLGTLGVGILAVDSARGHPQAWYQGFDPTNQALAGLLVATLAIGVLGVLCASAEYGSGTIRSSLSATPRRPLFLTGKVVVVAAIALAVGEAITFAMFLIGQALLSSGGAPHASLGQPGVLRAVALSGGFVALLALMGLGLGVIIRHTAGAIGAYVGITFLLALLISRLPYNPNPIRFTPLGILANSVSTVIHQPHQLAPTTGFLLMAIYTAITLAVAAAVIVRRDA